MLKNSNHQSKQRCCQIYQESLPFVLFIESCDGFCQYVQKECCQQKITFGENTFFLSSLFFTVFHTCTAILCWFISKLPELFRPIFTLCFIQLFCCFSLFFNFFFFFIFWYYWGPSGKRCKNAPLGKLMLGDSLALERNRNAKCKCAQRVHSFKRTSTCTKKN